MPTESSLQLDAVDLAEQAMDRAMMRSLVAIPQAPRKRGPKRMAPRLVERPSKTGGATILYIRDGGYEETTYQVLNNRAEAEKRLWRYSMRKDARARAIVNPRDTRVVTALDNLFRAERPEPGAPQKRQLAYQAACARLRTLTVFFDQTTLGELTKDKVKDFIEWRVRQPDARYRPDVPGAPLASVSSAGLDLSTLRKAIKLLAGELDLSWSPKIHIPKVESVRERHLIRSELARMLWAIRGRVWDSEKGGWKTEVVIDHDGQPVERRVLRPVETREARRILARFVMLGYNTGTRHEAMRGLRWIASSDKGCLDLEARIIHRQGFGTDPHKGKPQHTSKISRKFAAIARRWRDGDLAKGVTHVIHQPDGSPYLSRLKFIWACVVADAGLDDEVVPHVLRHTAATHLRVAKIDVRATADLLGMSVQTALRHYAHWTVDGQDDAADTLAFGRGIKGSIALEGLPAPRPPKPATPARIDDGQLEFPFEDPVVSPIVVEPNPKALPIPSGPIEPAEPILPPAPKPHPTHGRRTERRTRAQLGIAARGRVGLAPVPRFPEQQSVT